LNNSASQSNYNYSVITFILFWCGLVILCSMYVTLPLLTMFANTFDVTSNQATWIGSAFSLGYALGCLIYGPFSDKYGRKIFLMTSLIALTVVTTLIAFTDNFSALIVLRALQGIISAAFAPISFVYAAEMFPPHKRLTAVGFISSGLLMASIVGQVFTGIINPLFGWHAIFGLLGGIYLISSIVVILFVPKDTLPHSKESVLIKFKQMNQLFKHKQLFFLFLIMFMLLLSLVGMYTILGSYLTSPKWGLTSQQVLFVRAAGIIGMILSPFAGQFARKLGSGVVLRGGLALAIVGLIGLGFSQTLSLLIIASVIFVMGIAIVTPITVSLINQLAGSARGSAVAFSAFILFLGASTGPILALNLIKNGHFRLSFESIGLILLIGLGVSIFIKTKPGTVKEAKVRKIL